MTDTAIVTAGVIALGLIVILFVVAAMVRVARGWAEDRRREAAYADAWQRRHRAHAHDRYLTDDPRRPE